MTRYTTVVPAYGRDYKTQKAALADFHADKDFRVNDLHDPDDDQLCNKSQLSGRTVKIRYKRLTQVAVVKVK
jgi:hypothetical protein